MKILSSRLILYPIVAIVLSSCNPTTLPGSGGETGGSSSTSGVWVNPSGLHDNISLDGSNAQDPQVAMDDQGNTIVTWAQVDGDSYKIYKSEYRNGAWTNPTTFDDHISPNGSSRLVTGPIILQGTRSLTSPPPHLIAPPDAIHPQVAMDNHNNAIITWFQSDGFDTEIFKSEYRNGVWSNPSSVSDHISIAGEPASSPQVAMDDNGNAIITWFQYLNGSYQIFKSEYRGGVWTEQNSLTGDVALDTDAQSPQVAMDNNGNAIITWYQFDDSFNQIYKSEYRGGVWTNPAALTDHISPSGQDAQLPQVAMSDNGEAVITWLQFDGSKFQVYKSDYRGGVWTNPGELSDNISPDGQSAQHPQVAMDGAGNTIIVWYQSDGSNDQVFKSEYRGGVWTNPTTLTDNITPDGQYARLPQVAMDDNGNAVITWYQSDGTTDQIFKSEYRSGIWSYPTGLTDHISISGQTAGVPQVAMGNDSNAIIVWQQSDGNNTQIFKSEYR